MILTRFEHGAVEKGMPISIHTSGGMNIIIK